MKYCCFSMLFKSSFSVLLLITWLDYIPVSHYDCYLFFEVLSAIYCDIVDMENKYSWKKKGYFCLCTHFYINEPRWEIFLKKRVCHLSQITFAGLVTNRLLRTVSYRVVAMLGGFLFALGMLLTVFAQSIVHIIATYSIIAGEFDIIRLTSPQQD